MSKGDWYLCAEHKFKTNSDGSPYEVMLELNNTTKRDAQFLLDALRAKIVNYKFEKEPYKT